MLLWLHGRAWNFIAKKEMMGDNAAMIAWAYMKFYKKDRNDLFFKPMPRLEVRSVL